MKKFGIALLVVLIVAGLGACQFPPPAAGDGPGAGQAANGDPPSSPGGLSVDDEQGAGSASSPSVPEAGNSPLPSGASGVGPNLFAADWIATSPYPICPSQDSGLNGVSILEGGLMMVSFYDPFRGYEIPAFLNTYSKDGTLTAEYDCTKRPDAPGLIYCFGNSLPPGALVNASLAFGRRATVAIYDPTGTITSGADTAPDRFLAGQGSLDESLLFPAYFGNNRDFLAGIWGTEGTALEALYDFSAADQAAASMGFIGEVKTLVGVFNVVSACQIAAKLGGPLPEGCQELGSAYYQPQSGCDLFPNCYQECSQDLGLISPEGGNDLSMKELLDYLQGEVQSPLPAACSDYLYYSQSVLFIGSSGAEDEEDGSEFPDDLISSSSLACLMNPGSFLCHDQEENDGSDQEVQSIPVELASSVLTVGCALDPGNPLCSGDFPGGGSEGEVPVLSRCAVEIAWPGGIGSYSDASSLLTYLLSAGPSLKPGDLPASCGEALEEAAAPLGSGLGGLLSGVIYSGTVSSCIYQAVFFAPAEPAGGSGGGGSGSGSSKPSCGPGLIPVLWQGNWICIPEN